MWARESSWTHLWSPYLVSAYVVDREGRKELDKSRKETHVAENDGDLWAANVKGSKREGTASDLMEVCPRLRNLQHIIFHVNSNYSPLTDQNVRKKQSMCRFNFKWLYTNHLTLSVVISIKMCFKLYTFMIFLYLIFQVLLPTLISTFLKKDLLNVKSNMILALFTTDSSMFFCQLAKSCF